MLKKQQKEKNELENLIEVTKKKEKVKKEHIDKKWIATVVIVAFLTSFTLSFISDMTIPNLSLWLGILVTLFFIFLGIFFDIIGVSVTTADEAVFHSMSSRKVKGANIAVKFKKNADKVSSFCCDVIGDVCGIISGAAGTTIVAILVSQFKFNTLFTSITVAAIIAAITIGGKAIGKSFAINKSNIVLYEFAKFISNFYKK